jgi:hypothetical protein
MSKKVSKERPLNEEGGEEATSEQEYTNMELLERLETLREDMEELRVTTLAELIQRIEEMHQRLDAQ